MNGLLRGNDLGSQTLQPEIVIDQLGSARSDPMTRLKASERGIHPAWQR